MTIESAKRGMARLFELCSNASLKERATIRMRMARLEGETSNALFEILEEWNTYLNTENLDLNNQPVRKPRRRHRGPQL